MKLDSDFHLIKLTNYLVSFLYHMFSSFCIIMLHDLDIGILD